MTDELTEEELETLEQLGLGYPKEQDKTGIFAFFKKILITKDTTKVANLKEEELGMAKIPVRTHLDLSTYCNVMGLSGLGTYFKSNSHNTTDSSLGREGFLVKMAVTTKKEMETRVKERKENKGWFKKKTPEEQL